MLDTSWDAILLDALVALWPDAHGSLSSAHLYHYLVEHHAPPPAHGMQTLLSGLLQDHQIAGVTGINPTRRATDGAVLITWVSPDLPRRRHQYQSRHGGLTPMRV